jgi:hypothetical protein
LCGIKITPVHSRAITDRRYARYAEKFFNDKEFFFVSSRRSEEETGRPGAGLFNN